MFAMLCYVGPIGNDMTYGFRHILPVPGPWGSACLNRSLFSGITEPPAAAVHSAQNRDQNWTQEMIYKVANIFKLSKNFFTCFNYNFLRLSESNRSKLRCQEDSICLIFICPVCCPVDLIIEGFNTKKIKFNRKNVNTKCIF